VKRSILSMVVGFLALNAVVLAAVVTAQAVGSFPNPPINLSTGQYVALMVFSAAGGVLAGIAAGVVAGRAPLAHAAALAGVLFVVAIGDTHRQWINPSGAPHAILIGLLLSAPIGVMLGGLAQQARAARAEASDKN
jgi:hypothetical protein